MRSGPLPGFKQIKPRVFAGLFPVSSDDYEAFRDALAKLKLNDSALHYEPEVSTALGFGFRCGFLGLLHMDIVQERLEREYQLDLVTSAPTVVYEVRNDGRRDRPRRQPGEAAARRTGSRRLREPIIVANILLPPDYVGPVMKLCLEKRGVQKKLLYLGNQVSMQYELPLAEVVLDFFDRLKSVSRGYASFDYEFDRFQAAPLVQARHPDQRRRGRCAVDHQPPRQRLPARPRAGGQDAGADPAADVRGRDPGRDRRARHRALDRQGAAQERDWPSATAATSARKRKLLEKQKEGKKRMKQLGQVEIPQEAFLAVLQVGRKD